MINTSVHEQATTVKFLAGAQALLFLGRCKTTDISKLSIRALRRHYQIMCGSISAKATFLRALRNIGGLSATLTERLNDSWLWVQKSCV